jgi:hypothetical protein
MSGALATLTSRSYSPPETGAEEAIDQFFAAHAERKLSAEERTLILKLMEMQRHTQLMYTSCGWFFDDISGIETVQVMAYAARALRLAADIFGLNSALLEWQFVERLRQAKCNSPQWKDGGDIYAPGETDGGQPGAGGRALRHLLGLRQLSGRDGPLLLHHPPSRLRERHLGPRTPRHWPLPHHLQPHRRDGGGFLCRASFRRS